MLAFVVDADSVHRASVGISLAFFGYEVFQFEDGEQAVAAAQAVIPSLMIADVCTSGWDGIAMLMAIRQLHPRCRTIAMLRSPTALTDVVRATLGHLEIDASLVKPIDEATLATAILRQWETTIPLPGDAYTRPRRPLFAK